jgi:hypothetical protein
MTMAQPKPTIIKEFPGQAVETFRKHHDGHLPSEVSLTERRAEFVYNAARLAAISAGAPIIPDWWATREQAFKDQFLKVIERQCSEQRSHSPEELHGSWMQAYFAMGWVFGEKYDRDAKVHPDLIPYAQLGQLERDKDAVFVALCEIARQWIYE